MAGTKAQDLVDRSARLPVARQCEILGIPRSTYYYEPKKPEGFTEEEEAAMKEIDIIHTKSPCYGARKISALLRKKGYDFGRRHTKRLMDHMGIRAIYPHKDTSAPAKFHPSIPYLLRGKVIAHPNQVWSTDITYIPLGRTHVYFSAVIDWYSRYIVSWRLHDTLEAEEAVECMEDAFERYGTPAIANSDQGTTYTSDAYIALLRRWGVRQSMDGRGRWVDNVICERFWRSLKQECIYISEYRSMRDLERIIGEWVEYYNNERIHDSLDYETPAEWYFSGINAGNSAAA